MGSLNTGHKKRFEKEFETWDDYYRYKFKDITYLEVYKRTSVTVNFVKKLGNKHSLLDIGCGAGNLIDLISKKRPDLKIDGVDISENMVYRARKNNNVSNIYQHNIEEGSLKNKYDIITLMGVFPYFEDSSRALKNVDRTLNEGGFLIFTYNNKFSIFDVFSRTIKLIMRNDWFYRMINNLRKVLLAREEDLDKSILYLKSYSKKEILEKMKDYEEILEKDLIYSAGFFGKFSYYMNIFFEKIYLLKFFNQANVKLLILRKSKINKD